MSVNNDECSQCGAKAGFRCSVCKLTAYCSKECYAIHYRASHKVLCKRLSRTKDDICIAALANSTLVGSSSGAELKFVARSDREAFAKALCDYLLVYGEMNTPASIGAGLEHAKTLLGWSCDMTFHQVFLIIPWLCLLDPHPDSLRLCYNVINLDALYNNEVADVLEPWDASRKCVNADGCKYYSTPFHQLPHLLIKMLLLQDVNAFLIRLDALLVSRSPMWKDPVVITNLLPFLWPKHHCFERNALGARGGKNALGTVGDLRAAHTRLRDYTFFLRSMFVYEEGQLLLDLLLAEQPLTQCEGRPVACTCDVAPGSLQEIYAVARMYHAVVHNSRSLPMQQVLVVLQITAGQIKAQAVELAAAVAKKRNRQPVSEA